MNKKMFKSYHKLKELKVTLISTNGMGSNSTYQQNITANGRL